MKIERGETIVTEYMYDIEGRIIKTVVVKTSTEAGVVTTSTEAGE